ncbi:hypothetical protein PCASD_09021, partial [Puccinia coronata f. sp. avenae]
NASGGVLTPPECFWRCVDTSRMLLENASGGVLTPPECFWRCVDTSRMLLESASGGVLTPPDASGGVLTPPECFWRCVDTSRLLLEGNTVAGFLEGQISPGPSPINDWLYQPGKQADLHAELFPVPARRGG